MTDRARFSITDPAERARFGVGDGADAGSVRPSLARLAAVGGCLVVLAVVVGSVITVLFPLDTP
jgi:hypothetical protein